MGDGLGERVGHVLLPQPLPKMVVEPPGALHPRHDYLLTLRIEEEALLLLDLCQDEIEELCSGLRPDVAFQGGDGSLRAPDQLGDEGRIGLDWRGRACKV